ncbi:MAG: branched-chain amino acid ABC transporter permease [Phycisphaerae bacterium]|nr:branched-chain amino acid ABC transporter permease [Phycisphaerae bacterium]MDW8262638.1 branched-chain amino acid ABC transporter permease [Phycisphaerales bacterium]
MADFLQTLINAVTLGSLYALIALGYTMVYGVLKLINFAHSDVVVLGAWLSVTLGVFLLPFLGITEQPPPWWAGGVVLVLSMLICGAVGFLIERLAYKPIRKAPRLNALITAIGVSLFLQNTGQLQFTIIPAERVVARGDVIERGDDPRTVRLASPIRIESGRTYVVRIFDKGAPAGTAGTSRRLTAAPGEYEAGADLPIESPIGRAQTRNARFELVREATHPPLRLPFGAMPAAMPALFVDRPVVEHKFVSHTPYGPLEKPVRLTRLDLIIIGTAAALMVALQLLVYRTRIGTAMRAVSFNMETAALMGVPVNRVVSFTFVTGTMLAAAAGFLYALRYQQVQQPAHATWVLLGLKAFVAAVVGGIGNIRGATVGGYLIAFIEQFGVYAGQQAGWDNASAYTDVFVFLLLILVLLVKPTGIFGSTVREKV